MYHNTQTSLKSMMYTYNSTIQIIIIKNAREENKKFYQQVTHVHIKLIIKNTREVNNKFFQQITHVYIKLYPQNKHIQPHYKSSIKVSQLLNSKHNETKTMLIKNPPTQISKSSLTLSLTIVTQQ